MNPIVLQPNDLGLQMEALIIDGDLSRLSPDQRVMYYKKKCESLRLNYLTKPFAYIRLNGKLVLYALKDCSEQLRLRDHVSIYDLKAITIEGIYLVTAYGRTKEGKEDVATGAVSIIGLKGEALANAFMKAETKAKRRLTLSICGLGIPDESEIDSIPRSEKIDVNENGEMEEEKVKRLSFQKVINTIATVETIEMLEKVFFHALDMDWNDKEKKIIIEAKDRKKSYFQIKHQPIEEFLIDVEHTEEEEKEKDESVHYI